MGFDSITAPVTAPGVSVPRTAGFNALSFARSFVTSALSQVDGKTVPQLAEQMAQLRDNIETERQLADAADEAALQCYLSALRLLQLAMSKKMAGDQVHGLESPRNFASVGCSPETVLMEKQSGAVDVLRLVPGASGPVKMKGPHGEPTGT